MCDTFVALPPATADESIIFAKNSDRPYSEVQNITHYPRQSHKDAAVHCTYLEIPQVEETLEILLSQPLWMWGAEMGANEHGVIIGNEAVWTRERLGPPALLGMDLLRLGLERGQTAQESLQVMVELLEVFGQGGPCAENDATLSYHNSFLIVDRKEAWVLETANKMWVAERIREGVRNISNSLSIGTKYDLSADGISDYALEKGYYDGTAPFDFAMAFTEGPLARDHPFSRERWGTQLLTQNLGEITPLKMIKVLRDHEGGICMHGGFRTTASMVSHLSVSNLDVHWMTGTPFPCRSFFKPITFPVSSLAPYQPANEHKNLQTLWWSYETLIAGDSLSLMPDWSELENDYGSLIHSAGPTRQTELTQQAFATEKNQYENILKKQKPSEN
ncbi:MAG: C69 family dipeptidase [Candidatus Hodarchaeales archaeon]|jgi:secernin